MTPKPAVKTAPHSPIPDWPHIPGWPGYFVSENGDIFSWNWPGREFRKLAPTIDNHGYLLIRFSKNGIRKCLKIHQLVCSTYVGKRPTLSHEVRHLDGNRKNNHFKNLVWGTRKENSDDKRRHGNMACGEKHSQAIKAGFLKLAQEGK